ncbi:MAG: hypothetical protein V1899_07415 [Planctomycetota bacterium]
MTKVEQLEREISALSPSEIMAIREWFQAYLADEWDKQIEVDVKAGKLEHFAREALAEHKAERTKPL